MKTTHLAQVGAIPVRGASGAYEVLMITSRDSGRWIIPKGWPMKGKKDHAAAAQEAFEEAGVSGKVHKRPLGAYTYDKRIDGAEETVRVMVYFLEVREERRVWPEKDQRRREWKDPVEAAALVAEPGLATLLLKIGTGAKPGWSWPRRRPPAQ